MTRTKKALHALAVILVVAPLGTGCGSSNGDIVSPPARWTLTMSDEFDGDDGTPPDPTMWTYDIGGDGWGNNQLEFNTDRVENVSLDGEGHRRIRAIKESYEGNEYTSGRIKTQPFVCEGESDGDKICGFEQEHGRFDARMKLPKGRGLWPAFWMLGANIDEVPWPDSGEIDIMEYRGQEPERVIGTLHGPGYSGADPISDEFILPGGETFANEFFVILNLAVGGNFVGPVGPDTVFPADVLVDYVRIFERPQ